MIPAKKKRPDLAVVIGMGKPKKGDEEDEHDENGDPDGDEGAHEEAMTELHGALKADDMPRAVEAFRTLYDLCKSDHSDEEYDEEK